MLDVELEIGALMHLSMVHIQVGDAAHIPYDDSFDVAISLFVTCNLPSFKYYQELRRVIVPGKAALLIGLRLS